MRHPERRRPKAIVYALGCPEQDFERELKKAVESLGVPHGRVIVITDSLQLALMRRLGVGFQRVPAPGELGLDFDDPAYRRLLDERFDLAMSPWHGKWPMRGIGAGSAALRKEAKATAQPRDPSPSPIRSPKRAIRAAGLRHERGLCSATLPGIYGGAGPDRVVCRQAGGRRCDADQWCARIRLARSDAAQPGHHRCPEVRHQRPALLPGPASGGVDVDAEGAQLLHRGAQLGPRARVVRAPLRSGRPLPRRVLAQLHGLPPAHGRARADGGRAPGREADLHRPRPARPDRRPLRPQLRQAAREGRPAGRRCCTPTPPTSPAAATSASCSASSSTTTATRSS